MARSLDAILAELNPQYATSENILNTRLNAIPGEIDAGIAQSDAKLGQANDNILNSARRRGTGIAFGGIPLAEQAQYAATEYAPAIANLRATGANKELGLQEMLSQLTRDKSQQAQSIYDTGVAQDLAERQFQEQQRQFNEQQAAASRAAAASAYSFGGGAGATNQGKAPRSVQTRPGSFAFYDASDKPITAAQFALQTNQNLGDVLYDMGQAGDQSAQAVYTLLQKEARNEGGLSSAGYQNALKQLTAKNPYLLGGF